ncbi:MAG: ATP-binding cassette domain-containing protein [Candidatus Bathyarchaeia archaeon]
MLVDYAIKVNELSFKYEGSNFWVLSDISFNVKKGEIFAIVGPSEAGKTTLCMCLNGLIPHEIDGEFSGEVKIYDRDTRNHEPHELASLIGMVFQEPESQFVMTSVEDEIAFGMENLGIPPEEMEKRLDWALSVTRMKEFKDKPPWRLSGGQKQRVAIASALALRPNILVLDEPTSELDPIGKNEVLSIVKELNKVYGITIVIVEHETELLAEMADRVMLLNEGKIELIASVKEFFSKVDLLKKYGIFVPEVSELMVELSQKLMVPEIPITYEESKAMLKRIIPKLKDGLSYGKDY